MSTQQQQTQQRKTAVFDERGGDLEPGAEHEMQAVPEPEAEPEAESEAPAAEEGKYRIGDKVFQTLEEAHAYATSQVQQANEADAYRQIVQEALIQTPQPENVTQPQEPEIAIDEEKLWADPKAFLADFARKVSASTAQKINQSLDHQAALRAQGEQIWGEFTSRHPDLADFRGEAEEFTAQNKEMLQKLTRTKGRQATYDYIAMNLKAKFARYASAVKPRRELPNGSGGPSPSQRAPSVTPPKPAKKPLSFTEQIRSIKRVKR